MDELVTTEIDYVVELRLIFKTSLQIEGANIHKEMFPPSQLEKMFPAVEELHMFHSEILLPALKARQEQWSTNQTVTDIWTKYLPDLSMYKNYTSWFSQANALIEEYRKNKPEFGSLLGHIESKGEFQHLTLNEHMLHPTQRITKYRLLLQGYLDHLPPSEEEWQPLTSIIEKLGNLLKDCQDDKDLCEEFLKLQNRLEDTISELNPRAKFLKEGPVVEVMSNSTKIPLYFFLFTDFLLVCSKREKETKYSIVMQFDTAKLKVRPSNHLHKIGHPADVTMLLRDPEKVLPLLFPDASSKLEWEEKLLHATKMKSSEHKPKVSPENVVPFSQAPEWMLDECAISCPLCEDSFVKLINRRHHCRACGIVVCKRCSGNKMALPFLGNKEERVCDYCCFQWHEDNPKMTRRIDNARKNLYTETPDGKIYYH